MYLHFTSSTLEHSLDKITIEDETAEKRGCHGGNSLPKKKTEKLLHMKNNCKSRMGFLIL